MTSLRESVRIITPGGELDGFLDVALDGLPELHVTGGGYHERGVYRVTTLPAAWTVNYRPGNADDLLLNTWRAIGALRQEIIDAQREAEQETPNAGE